MYNAYLNIWSLQIPYSLCCIFCETETAKQKTIQGNSILPDCGQILGNCFGCCVLRQRHTEEVQRAIDKEVSR